MFDTPILLIVFNRPKTTKRLMDCVQKLQPKQLFIAADGPRLNNPKDKTLCEQTRAVFKHINWDCEVKMLFRAENIGVGRGVSEGISWFFDHVEEGIILEDDCIPHPTFFSF